MTTGTLDVLNCGAGHMQFTFDKEDPIELERAKRVITDMLRRGYALFIEDDKKKLHKVKTFDANQGVYIIADSALYAGDTEDVSDASDEPEAKKGNGAVQEAKIIGKQRRGVPMRKARATGIGPTAGG